MAAKRNTITLLRGLFFLAVSILPLVSEAQSDRATFFLSTEFFGSQAYTDPAAHNLYTIKAANGFTLGPPVDAGMSQFFSSHSGSGFIFNNFGATKVGGKSAATIESERAAAANVFSLVGRDRSAWNAMAEWDQGGGHWVPNGRPSYSGLTRAGAYTAFRNYYLNNSPPLGTYLQQPIAGRNYRLLAQTDYAPNAFYAYEFGVEVNLLERAIDELGDISTGIAFIRGAAKQYGRPWGIDLSTWRTSADSATSFDSQQKLIGGWSPNYLRRHLYAGFMNGAHIIQIEATSYYQGNGQLNPFGQMVRDFSNFALERHADVGKPVVDTAVMLDFNSGFDTKHGLYNQSDSVWYQDLPYSNGDYMINNFFKIAFPNHWQHGTTPNAPFSDSTGYKSFLANGGDPRPYEPMPTTRWGDTINVILSNAPSSALQQYKVIILLGDVQSSADLSQKLESWVQQGGTLVLNASQSVNFSQNFLGASIGAELKTGTSSKWSADSSVLTESSFQFKSLTPTTATTLATDNGVNTLVTSNSVGQGKVILTSPVYLQTTAKDKLLAVTVRLLDFLYSQNSVVKVNGSPIEFAINRATGKIIVTAINNSGSTWSGNLTATVPGTVERVKEYILDTDVARSIAGREITIAGNVPPYDLRVYAFEFTPDTLAPAAPSNLRDQTF